MDEKITSVEEKIIAAAIECIERYGIQATTNRKIAEIAGVNGAAVNYYFRSKDVLIQKVMEVTLKNAFDWQDHLAPPQVSAQEHARAIFYDLLDGAVHYPQVTRAHFYGVINTGDYNSQTVQRLDEFIDQLVADLRRRGSELDEAGLRLAVAQMMSAIFMLALAPGLYAHSLGLDMRSEADRRVYVDRLVERLLTDV